jgi:hypothetical protein
MSANSESSDSLLQLIGVPEQVHFGRSGALAFFLLP